jgi:hypothetical protein
MSYITIELHDLIVGNRYFIFNKFMGMKVVKNVNPLFATFKGINKETNIPIFTDILEIGCPDFSAEYSSDAYQICKKKEIIITI